MSVSNPEFRIAYEGGGFTGEEYDNYDEAFEKAKELSEAKDAVMIVVQMRAVIRPPSDQIIHVFATRLLDAQRYG